MIQLKITLLLGQDEKDFILENYKNAITSSKLDEVIEKFERKITYVGEKRNKAIWRTTTKTWNC